MLEESIALDEEAGNTGLLGPQYVALAETYLALGETTRAVAAAETAAGLSKHESVLFPPPWSWSRPGATPRPRRSRSTWRIPSSRT